MQVLCIITGATMMAQGTLFMLALGCHAESIIHLALYDQTSSVWWTVQEVCLYGKDLGK